MDFMLHPRLESGSFDLARFSECRLMLKDNAIFPWLILVPEVPTGVEDLHQLDPVRYAEVMEAIRRVSCFVSGYFQPEKLNVACIGNVVRQMHIHIVGRSPEDPAWPGTVWAFDEKESYTPERVVEIRAAAREYLGED